MKILYQVCQYESENNKIEYWGVTCAIFDNREVAERNSERLNKLYGKLTNKENGDCHFYQVEEIKLNHKYWG